MLIALTIRLQKYKPEYLLKMTKTRMSSSIELYHAIAVNAVIARGSTRFAPYMSKLAPVIPLVPVTFAMLLRVSYYRTRTFRLHIGDVALYYKMQVFSDCTVCTAYAT